MKESFRSYLNSFKFKSNFWFIFLIELMFFAVLLLLFTWFSQTVHNQSVVLMQGKTPLQVQEILATAQPEEVLSYATGLKSYLLFTIICIFVIGIFSFFSFSLTQAVIWNKLLNRKFEFKRYWRWNGLPFILIIPLIFYFLFSWLMMFLILIFFQFFWKLFSTFYVQHAIFADAIQKLFSAATLVSLFVLGILFLFLISYILTKEYKIWKSIGDAFDLVKTKRKKIVITFLYAVLTANLLALIIMPIRKLSENFEVLSLSLDIIFVILFLAWFRTYIVNNLEEH